MLSRIEFLFKDHLNIDRNAQPRVKLNNKKLKYIINQKDNEKSSAELVLIYRITIQYINKIYYNYINCCKTEFYKKGSRNKVIDKDTEKLVITYQFSILNLCRTLSCLYCNLIFSYYKLYVLFRYSFQYKYDFTGIPIYNVIGKSRLSRI